MKRKIYDLIAEPKGEIYRILLKETGPLSQRIWLVMREGLGLDSKGQKVLQRLTPYQIRIFEASEWPGTTLLNSVAKIHEYEFCNEALEVITEATHSLYGWKQPDLPEDIAFLRADGSTVLATIAHEKDAFMELSDEEYRQLTQDRRLKSLLKGSPSD